MTVLLAVDGGGTKTDVALIDHTGRILHRAQGAGCNPFDQPRWEAILGDLLAPLRGQYVVGALGLPGYGEAPEFTRQQQAYAASLGVPVVTVNDVDAAHRGAFLDGPGVLILAGTGSMAWGRDRAGQAARVGGWGDLLGDEGAAYWVGQRALNSLTRALDGRATRTALHDRLMGQISPNPLQAGQNEAPVLLGWLAGLEHQRSSIAALARTVEQTAQDGDPLALGLLREAAGELALLAQTVQQKLPSAGKGWSLAGSFTQSQTVRAALLEQLGAAEFQLPALPPLGGVALLAAQRAGWTISPQWTSTLGQQLSNSTFQTLGGSIMTSTTTQPATKPVTNVENSITEQFPLWVEAEQVTRRPFAGRYVLVGCGSSYYIAQSVAAAMNRNGQKAVAVAGNEWAQHSSAYVTAEEQVEVIAISRSGESTETVQALRAAQQNGLQVIGITNEAGSTLAKEANTVLYSRTHPQEGVVMSASASLNLLQGLRLAGIEIDGQQVAQAAEQLLNDYGGQLDRVFSGRQHFVFLGAAELHGVAQEGALKLMEMSLSFSQCYFPLEYRHGPMSLVDDQTLIVLLYHPDTAAEEARLAAEMQQKGAVVIGIGGPGDLSIPLTETSAARRGLIALPLLQWLGQRVALSKGIDAEQPRHLSKVVEIS